MMFENKPRFGVMRILAVILLLVIIIGGGYLLFRAGFSQGMVSSGEGAFTAHEFGRSVRWITPYHAHFFFPGGFLLGLLFLFLIFGLVRRAFFAPRWGMHRMYGMNWEEKAQEWHTELHIRMQDQPAATDEAKQEQTEE